MNTIGSRLKEARENKGWSQRELAIMSGSSNASVSRWETNQREMTAGNIISVCNALNISPNWLLTGSDDFSNHDQTKELKACYELIGKYDNLEKRVLKLEKRDTVYVVTYLEYEGDDPTVMVFKNEEAATLCFDTFSKALIINAI